MDLKDELATASTVDDFQDVGRRCREILIDLAELVFDESMVVRGAVMPARNDAKSRLDLFFATRLPGPSNEEIRRFAKAAVGLANAVVHDADATDVHAFAVAQATLTLVRLADRLDASKPGRWGF